MQPVELCNSPLSVSMTGDAQRVLLLARSDVSRRFWTSPEVLLEAVEGKPTRLTNLADELWIRPGNENLELALSIDGELHSECKVPYPRMRQALLNAMARPRARYEDPAP